MAVPASHRILGGRRLPIDPFSPVRLITSRYAELGVTAGVVGTVLDLSDDGYEVDFSRPDGTSVAWFAVRRDEIELALPTDAATLARLGD